MTQSVTFVSPESGPNQPEQTAAEKTERPAWLPESFKTPEDLVKSYAEAQAELTRTKQELARLRGTQPATTEQATDPAAQKTDAGLDIPDNDSKADEKDEAAKQVAEAAGLDLDPYQQEFFETGDVSPESRSKIVEKLSKLEVFKGLDVQALVNDYIEGKKALIKNDRALFMEEAGGEEQYNAMVQWAAQNLPRDEIDAYNRQVQSGDRHATLFAIRGLRAKFEAANGRSPSRFFQGSGGTPGLLGFRSTAEMVQAMSDPRYQTDPAYREEVKRRLAISNF